MTSPEERSPGSTAPAVPPARILIRRERAEVYAYWRDFTNLPRFVERVKNVSEVDALSSIWTVLESQGRLADWEFIVTDDERGRLIAWSTSGHTPIRLAGRVEFEDAAAGATQLTLHIESAPPPPAGVLEQLLSREPAPVPEIFVPADLERLKRRLEAGEPVRVPGSSAAADRATEQGIGIIAPEPPGPDPVGGDLQSIRAARRWACGAAQ